MPATHKHRNSRRRSIDPQLVAIALRIARLPSRKAKRVQCTECDCSFTTTRDTLAHHTDHPNGIIPNDVLCYCPSSGCQFRTLQFTNLEAHFRTCPSRRMLFGNKGRRTPHRYHGGDIGSSMPTALVDPSPHYDCDAADPGPNQPTATSTALSPMAGPSGGSDYFSGQEQDLSWAAVSTTGYDMGASGQQDWAPVMGGASDSYQPQTSQATMHAEPWTITYSPPPFFGSQYIHDFDSPWSPTDFYNAFNFGGNDHNTSYP